MIDVNEYQRRWRKENPAKCKAYKQKHYRLHKEEVLARSRRYFQANHSKRLLYAKRWREAHPGYTRTPEYRAAQALRRGANREVLRAYNREYQRRRRAMIKAGTWRGTQ